MLMYLYCLINIKGENTGIKLPTYEAVQVFLIEITVTGGDQNHCLVLEINKKK